MIASLDEYMAHFAGYGDLRAPLWFVGMEEGGGRDVAELAHRVGSWVARGRHRLEDLATYHRAIGLARHVDPPFPLQRTWGPLARVLQAWRAESTDVPALRRVQAADLGAHGGSGALLELMPLPATGTSAWPYASLARDIPALLDRAQYRSAYEAARVRMLRALIDEGQPRAVICYGLGDREAWTGLAGAPLHATTIDGRTCYASKTRAPLFLAVPHPVAHGSTSRFWEAVGASVRARTA